MSSHPSAALGTVTPTKANGRETKLMSRNIELFSITQHPVTIQVTLVTGTEKRIQEEFDA